MRRRQQQIHASNSFELESGIASTEKIESSSSTNENNIMSKSPRNTPMTVATTFEVDSGASATEGRNKPFSLCPRNYTGRRQLFIAGCFFLFMIIIALQVNKSNDNGKKRKSNGRRYTSTTRIPLSFGAIYEYIRKSCCC
ncbi:MAG: hypothetical protein ACI8RD_007795 [Bacillariaceae sp.]|jgi:hypothetical protein